MTQTQAIPEFENDNLLAKVFTSRKWQKKLSNQNMNYQWIPCDQSQIQNMLNQVQVNIPNAYIDSCESDYFTFTMKMKIAKEKMNRIVGSLPYDVGAPDSYMIVQYKNALYLILYNTDEEIYDNKMLNRFVNAIEGTDIPNGSDKNWNNKDFGFAVNHVYGKTKSVSSSAGIIMTDSQMGISVSNNGEFVDPPTQAVVTENTGSGFQVKNASVTTTQTVPDTMTIAFAYQKIMNLPFNSCCFLERTVLRHENVDKSKPLQQINRLIYRQQYDPNITQQYMNSHWYVYYGNNKPQVLYTNDYNDQDVIFSYQVMIPMNKIFWLWQQDYLPLFKLKNPLNLQFIFNGQMIKGLFEVMTFPTSDPKGPDCQLNYTHASLQTFVDYNTITYYNLGCFLLASSDTVLQKKVVEELNDIQGICLGQTQCWIESYKTNTSEERQYQTNVGFNCLTDLRIQLYADTNNAYMRGYSTLKDICAEYRKKIKDNNNNYTYVQFWNPQQQDLDWYKKQLSLYMLNITFNGKQTFIGQKFMNSIPLYLSINNRGQDTDDQNPFTENLFDYFNVLSLRYQQFTDKYVKDVEPDEINYSGVSIQKQNNNYITCLLANYNTSDYSSGLQKFSPSLDNEGVIQKSDSGIVSKDYFVELQYYYKQILQIDQSGNLTQMLQEYML